MVRGSWRVHCRIPSGAASLLPSSTTMTSKLGASVCCSTERRHASSTIQSLWTAMMRLKNGAAVETGWYSTIWSFDGVFQTAGCARMCRMPYSISKSQFSHVTLVISIGQCQVRDPASSKADRSVDRQQFISEEARSVVAPAWPLTNARAASSPVVARPITTEQWEWSSSIVSEHPVLLFRLGENGVCRHCRRPS